MTQQEEPIIEVKDVSTTLGDTCVHSEINLTVQKGEVLAIVGGSGSGKTTLLREMMALLKPTTGTIKVFGQEILNASPKILLAIQKRWGVLFQQNALFSSLNLLENIIFPIKEHTELDEESRSQLALLKILMTGLPANSALKYPAELSGGMQKRAGLARAIALDPELLFLDEPSSGLDPQTAAKFDQLILDLQSTMGLTIVMVTHDVDSLWKVANRVAFLAEGKVIKVAPMAELVKDPDPLIQAFFNGPRGRVAQHCYQNGNDQHGN